MHHWLEVNHPVKTSDGTSAKINLNITELGRALDNQQTFKERKTIENQIITEEEYLK